MHKKGLLARFAQLSIVCLALALLLSACQIPTPAATTAGTPTAAAQTVEPSDALAADQAAPPVKLAIPALHLEMPIQPMGWEMTEVNGQPTTRWIVPKDAIGWHVNSTGAGGAGNTILSGHQAQGEALFAPLATGEIVVGQELLLTDETGNVFAYRIKEVSDPIAMTGASKDELARADAYIAPSQQAKLTLITGWPDFTTTHRVFAVAEFVGKAK